jgi:hypothetical protein
LLSLQFVCQDRDTTINVLEVVPLEVLLDSGVCWLEFGDLVLEVLEGTLDIG